MVASRLMGRPDIQSIAASVRTEIGDRGWAACATAMRCGSHSAGSPLPANVHRRLPSRYTQRLARTGDGIAILGPAEIRLLPSGPAVGNRVAGYPCGNLSLISASIAWLLLAIDAC